MSGRKKAASSKNSLRRFSCFSTTKALNAFIITVALNYALLIYVSIITEFKPESTSEFQFDTFDTFDIISNDVRIIQVLLTTYYSSFLVLSTLRPR